MDIFSVSFGVAYREWCGRLYHQVLSGNYVEGSGVSPRSFPPLCCLDVGASSGHWTFSSSLGRVMDCGGGIRMYNGGGIVLDESNVVQQGKVTRCDGLETGFIIKMCCMRAKMSLRSTLFML